VPRHNRAGVEIEFKRRVQRRGWAWVGRVHAAHGPDHSVYLAKRERCRGHQSRWIGGADGVAQLSGDRRPRGVAVTPV
jgi:hypothetical protein